MSKIDNRCVVQLYGYTHAFHRLNFTEYWMYNFEIRVGDSEELGNNDVCHKQLDFMDSLQANITCSCELYGDWVSLNSTDTASEDEILAFLEVRVFGRGKDGYKCKRTEHKSTTTQYFVGCMSGGVFDITTLLCIDEGVPVAYMPARLGPSRHFLCGLVRNECWKKSNNSINPRCWWRHFTCLKTTWNKYTFHTHEKYLAWWR